MTKPWHLAFADKLNDCLKRGVSAALAAPLAVFLTALLALGGTADLAAQPQNLARDTQGKIEFASFTPATMFDLARERRENWAPVKISGDLSFPKSQADSAPAMVLMHGSGGIERSMAQWVEALNEIGVATFVVSSFEPRGFKRTAENQALVPPAANLMDAFAALQVLAGHPRIERTKIGVMGFSRGGEVAFRSALEPLRAAVVKSDLKFTLHIPVYAGCNQVYWSPQTTKAPMLNLVGAADDYTTAEPCEALAKRYLEAGSPIRTVNYPGAHHSWDATYPVQFLPNMTTGAPCGVVLWDIEAWRITSERTGKTLDPNRLDAFFGECVRRGANVGRNEAAFRQSRQDVQAFVREVFILPSAAK